MERSRVAAWIGISIVGVVLGSVVVRRIGHLGLDDTVMPRAFAITLAGAALGAGQLLSLGKHLRSAWSWLGASAVGWLLGAAGMISAFFLGALLLPSIGFNVLLGGAMGGLILGSIQWIALASELRGGFHWIFFHVLGGIGMAFGVAAVVVNGGSTLAYVSLGAIYAAASGYGLAGLQPIPEAARGGWPRAAASRVNAPRASSFRARSRP